MSIIMDFGFVKSLIAFIIIVGLFIYGFSLQSKSVSKRNGGSSSSSSSNSTDSVDNNNTGS